MCYASCEVPTMYLQAPLRTYYMNLHINEVSASTILRVIHIITAFNDFEI